MTPTGGRSWSVSHAGYGAADDNPVKLSVERATTLQRGPESHHSLTVPPVPGHGPLSPVRGLDYQ